ncbi:hypothetical protein [Pseudohongiella sp.]|uniref:Uncharacterized protein n=1 Tax=marine sediment metagenome TaxID=412755 RepID=A0A0F9WDG7_9ZZZZ|nr:hypothetical protein [Pseudohongiella sp.]HDZ09716.1 hypothetical protein [Pseudohongiella sp.]HEA61670.1 hypothetical protein [Pseudohongiella sp.]
MLGIYGYITSWAVYLTAGTLCYILFYKATGAIGFKPLANVLRGIMIALIYTPWYVAADEDLMAPAVIVILLDMITIGGDAFIRGLVPLTLALTAAIVIALMSGLLRALVSRSGKR